MGLFSKSKIDDLPSFEEQVGMPVRSEPVSKEVELIATVKDEFSIAISGIIRQSQKKLLETNDMIGTVEGHLHNVKIYQNHLKQMAGDIEAKLLYMRGGRPETLEDDLSEEELDVITYIKAISNHISSTIIGFRDLRKLLSKISIIPSDPQSPPLESGREFGEKVVDIVHKVDSDLKRMNENFVKIYALQMEVEEVAKKHGISFSAPAQQQ